MEITEEEKAGAKYLEHLMQEIAVEFLEVTCELATAMQRFPPFNSAHEGFAVILEECDELRAEVWKKQTERDPLKMRKEAVQLAAMAVRFLHDVCHDGRMNYDEIIGGAKE